MNFVISKLGGGFFKQNGRGIAGTKVQACTDVYSLGRKKVIPISHIDDFLICHLPNRYAFMWEQGCTTFGHKREEEFMSELRHFYKNDK